MNRPAAQTRENDVLIFGITGQDGQYLTSLCEQKGFTVHGISRSNGEWITGNVSDQSFVRELIRELPCRYIFHLAASSTTSHEAVFENHEAIATGTINILEACRKYSPESRVFLAGSALQFEAHDNPVSLSMPFAATSAYVVARNYASLAARYYRTIGLRTYVGYFCHHDSPLRREQHLTARIVQAIKRIQHGSSERIEMDHPDVVKEYNFAGDIVEAVWMLVQQDVITECVIGSGQGYSVQEWADICLRRVGLNPEGRVFITGHGVRPFKRLVADPSCIKALGWEPRVNIYSLSGMMLGV